MSQYEKDTIFLTRYCLMAIRSCHGRLPDRQFALWALLFAALNTQRHWPHAAYFQPLSGLCSSKYPVFFYNISQGSHGLPEDPPQQMKRRRIGFANSRRKCRVCIAKRHTINESPYEFSFSSFGAFFLTQVNASWRVISLRL